MKYQDITSTGHKSSPPEIIKRPTKKRDNKAQPDSGLHTLGIKGRHQCK
jgi:hypothetical protein